MSISGILNSTILWLIAGYLSYPKVSDIQMEDDASLKHAMDLCSGKRVQKIIQQTMASAFTLSALDDIGCTCEDDPNASDILQFHSQLLLNHLGFLFETSIYHESFPWKLVLFLRTSTIPSLMEEMKNLWAFITTCVDTLDPKSSVAQHLVWTRAQAFREPFIVAESLGLVLSSKN